MNFAYEIRRTGNTFTGFIIRNHVVIDTIVCDNELSCKLATMGLIDYWFNIYK
jgi:hypothetical protein